MKKANKNFYLILNLLLIVVGNTFFLEAKKIKVSPKNNIAHQSYKNWFSVKPVQDILQQYPNIRYTKCFDEISFSYRPFPLINNFKMQPNFGRFKETFILTIPNGSVYSKLGLFFIDNCFIKELMWKEIEYNLLSIKPIKEKNIIHFSGRVAVIAQITYNNYCHWINEILSRLALLELAKIDYDWLYVPQDSAFMRDTLELWGIDRGKIIAPTSDDFAITADEIIIPSFVSNTDFMYAFLCANYFQPYLLKYIQNKFLKKIPFFENKDYNKKKIFISRRDAPFRKVVNEEELFNILKEQGFVRCELSSMSFQEQVNLFRNADVIISAHGSGLTNIIFSKPGTTVIELFQYHADCTFWYLSQQLGLNYIPVETVPFPTCDHMKAWQKDTEISLNILNSILTLLSER
ncbi:glycosyltransferase family 61 protein [Candidatus Dependentiae bacterium]|nr:glycosyltransferase family 61 protein [Candidatus Dependentiae bacterium]